MSNTPFQQLKARFQSLGKDFSQEGLETAKSALQSWLEQHSEVLSKRKAATESNGTMMQAFHWYIPADGSHWKTIEESAQELAKAGFTALWLPPAYKGIGGGYDVGYGAYDLFDLGEFDQKGTVRTKYGTRQDYVDAVTACRKHGLQVYADVVFNHKMAADFEEESTGSKLMTTMMKKTTKRSLTLFLTIPITAIRPSETAAKSNPGPALILPVGGTSTLP